MQGVREIYESSIRQLPALERLRLATLILDQLTSSAKTGSELSDVWSDEDIEDLAAFSARYAESLEPSEDGNA